MVMRIGVIGKKLKTGVTVDALRARTRYSVGESIRGDHARTWIAEGTVDFYGVRRRGILRLQTIACLAQMRALSADVAYLEQPLPPQGAPHGQVPLLGAGHHKVPRDLQAENVDARKRSGACAAARVTVVCGLRRIPTGETLEHREARDK